MTADAAFLVSAAILGSCGGLVNDPFPGDMGGIALLLGVVGNGAAVGGAAMPVGGGVRVPCSTPGMGVGRRGGLFDLNVIGGSLIPVLDGQGQLFRCLLRGKALDHIRGDGYRLPALVGEGYFNGKA